MKKRQRLFRVALVVIFSVAIVPLLLVCAWASMLLLSYGFSGNLFSYFLVLPFGIASYLLFNILILHRFSKGTLKFERKFSWQRISLVFATIFSLLIVILACSFVYLSYTEKPPQFFSLDDEMATYTIVKDSNGLYAVSYRSITNETQIKVLVGQSFVELEPYVNTSVRLTGEFVYGHQQCMPTECIGVPNAALFNIHSIK